MPGCRDAGAMVSYRDLTFPHVDLDIGVGGGEFDRVGDEVGDGSSDESGLDVHDGAVAGDSDMSADAALGLGHDVLDQFPQHDQFCELLTQRLSYWEALRGKRTKVPGSRMALGRGDMPHDLKQLIVEATTGLENGFWGRGI